MRGNTTRVSRRDWNSAKATRSHWICLTAVSIVACRHML